MFPFFKSFDVMVDQTISYNDKSIARRGWGKEAHNSQRLFFIQKELQLNTKFHYIEVATTSENYKITLCISKTTVKAKIVLHIGLHPVKTKNPKKKYLKKGKGKEKKRECERERKIKGKEKEKEKEKIKEKEKKKEKEEEKGKEEKKKEEKTERAVLKVFFEYTAPSRYIP